MLTDTMPKSIEVEQYLLGCLLIDSGCLQLVSECLSVDDFYNPRHQQIFQVVLDQVQRQEPIDIVIVAQRLKERSQLELVGGRAYLVDLLLAVASTLYIPYYVRILKEKSTLRKLVKVGRDITSIAYSTIEVSEAICKAHAALLSVPHPSMIFQPFSQQQSSQLIERHGEELWDRFWDYMEKQTELGAGLQYVRACHKALLLAQLAREVKGAA